MNTSTLYYLNLNGQQAGPYTLGQIRSMWQAGTVTAQAEYWFEGAPSWQPLLQLAWQLEPQSPTPGPQLHPSPTPRQPTSQPPSTTTGTDVAFLAFLGVAAIAAIVVSRFTSVGFPASFIVFAIVGITSVWTAFDSHRLRISSSKKPYTWNNGSLSWLLSCLLLWIAAFPSYLTKRAKTLRERNSSSGSVSWIGVFLMVIALACTAAQFFGLERLSVDQLRDQVRTNIETKLKENPVTQNVRIKDFTLIHRGGNDYTGILVADSDAGEERLPIEVTYDGENFVLKFK